MSIKAWPVCRLPVTFGGGKTIEKTSASLSVIPFSIQTSGLKKPLSSQSLRIFSSVSCGSYGFNNFSLISILK